MAPPGNRATFSIPSIIAVICAVLSFFDTGFGFVFAILAIIFGVIGALIAVSPSRRGGIMSIIAVVLGILAAIVSILGLIFGIVF